MSKIESDKYYTPVELAKYCIDKTYEIIGEENISEVIEPSAGNGSFSSQINNCMAYDIEPENEEIIRQDFLELDLKYKKGRLIIGNPPFGTRGSLAVKFFKKAIELGDYVAFILPISQYKNTQKMYEFDLIYSEDLGIKKYSDIDIHCCFNIYKRPTNGELNRNPPKYDLKDIEIVEFRRGSKDIAPEEYDFGMCTWGDGSCGKQVEFQGQYAQEHYIVVKNPIFKEKIIKLCNETDWRHLYPSVSSAKLQTWKIYKYIKEQIPEIE
jgi:predicted RNA methylase